jgi:agmatine deiminase
MVSARQTSTPRATGYAQPAEWEQHRACYTAWPAHEYAWGEHLHAAQASFVAFAAAFSEHPEQEKLHILVGEHDHEQQARAALSDLGDRVVFVRMPYGDVWLRDTAPIFLRGGGEVATLRFRFNGWGQKYIYLHDAELASRLAERHGGRALEVDGRGTCLTTRSCLLNENRGGVEDEQSVQDKLRDALGIDKVIWLDQGLENDHTDGHIDNIARFVAPGVAVCLQASGEDDPNRDTLDAIAAQLTAATDARGERLTVLRIPSPGRVLGADGNVVPASYLNFYIGNRTVIVPGFGSRWDEPAREALQAIFRDRRVLMSGARSLLEGGGTFHCMTQQEPLP